jgi:hypothetical protein
MAFRFLRVLPAILLAILVLSPIAIFPKPAWALGLSPPAVTVDSLLRGTTQKRTVTLFRAPNEEGNIFIHVKPETSTGNFIVGGEDDIVILDGQDRIDYEFEIGTGDVANGKYKTRLVFLKTVDPNASLSGSGVSIVSGVAVKVVLTVGGEEHLSYRLLQLSSGTTEVGRDIDVSYMISNDGNVEWRIQKIRFDFQDGFTNEVVASYEVKGDALEPVKAGEQGQKFDLKLPIILQEGRYGVTATFYYQDEEAGILKLDDNFQVFPEGTLAQSGVLNGLSLNKTIFCPGEKIKLDAIFKNDGAIALGAVLFVQMSRNSEVIDLIRGSEYAVEKGEEMIFSQLLDAQALGLYEIEGYVEYGKKKSNIQKISFEVQDKVVDETGTNLPGVVGKVGSTVDSYVGLLILIILIILGTVCFILIKHHRRKRELPEPQPLVKVEETETTIAIPQEIVEVPEPVSPVVLPIDKNKQQ